MPNNLRKSVYLYLSCLLGILLFLILHRVFAFFYFILASLGYHPFINEVGSLQFLAFEYFTLILTLMLGAWYGIWLGIYWYQKVYEEGSFPGVVDRIAGKSWFKRKGRYDLKERMETAKHHLEKGVWELEHVASSIPTSIASPEPIKKRVVRRRAPKKLKA